LNQVMFDFQEKEELKVRLPIFEGPLDLLLYLIKKDEVDVYDIPIERITKEYLEYLQVLKMMNLDLAGEFIVMAATLMYIKSRTLLPADMQPPEPDAEESDPRWDLIRQLVEYKKFKEAAFQLQQLEISRERVFPRQSPPQVSEMPLSKPVEEVGVFDLITAFQKVLERINKTEDLKEIFEDKHTVGDKIQMLTTLFSSRERVLFFDLFREAGSRTEVVVTFLALLEMVRLKRLKVVQSEMFGEIEIYRAGVLESSSEPETTVLTA